MTNSKKETKKVKEQPKLAEPINEGFYDKNSVKLVPKILHNDENINNIARELKAGRYFVFAKSVERNGQYNVRKKLKKQHPELKFAQGIIEATGQDALYMVE